MRSSKKTAKQLTAIEIEDIQAKIKKLDEYIWGLQDTYRDVRDTAGYWDIKQERLLHIAKCIKAEERKLQHYYSLLGL